MTRNLLPLPWMKVSKLLVESTHIQADGGVRQNTQLSCDLKHEFPGTHWINFNDCIENNTNAVVST